MAIKINGVTVIDDSQNFTSSGTISATGNITSAGNIVTTGTIVGNVQTTGPVSTTGNITAGNISATGNIAASFFVGNGSQLTGIDATQIQSGTSNVKVVSSGGNVTASVGGTPNVVVIASSGTVTTGSASVTGGVTAASVAGGVITGTSTSVTGGVTAASVAGGVITGTSTSVTGTQTAASTVGGVITGTSSSLSGNVTGGNILTAGQVSVTGNLTGGAMTIFGNATILGNLRVDGTETIFNTQSLSINDLDVIVANNVTGGANINGAGIQAGNPATATWFYNHATTSWQGNFGITPSANATLSLGGASNYWATLFATGASVAGNITAAGNITGNYILGNGSQLTGLSGSSISNGTSNVVVAAGGNVSIAVGGANIISITSAGIINNQANALGNIGNSTGYFNTIFAKATSAQYADLAEMYVADAAYPAGTVVEFGGEFEITLTRTSHSTKIAGIVSTNPSYLMNATQSGNNVLPIALTGRVPCQVVGTIAKGDRLVASDYMGAAQRLDPDKYQPGCIIGKSLEDYDSETIGLIEIAVGRF